ncbi:MAG: sulfotransferase [Rhodothermia bacterium]|nr:sulfotransferase [Rhodothermia bacterium]
MSDWQYLFIAGASRSGTTLLMNLLDGHPDLVVFPMEHRVFPGFFRTPPENRPAYFHGSFIEDRAAGQQSILASKALHDKYRERMERELGIDFFLDVDHEKFLETYRKTLGPSQPTLRAVLDSLMVALLSSSRAVPKTADSFRYAVFKDPFTTEFFAQETAKELPKSRFIHIIRNPYARYCSVKRRNIRTARLTQRRFVKRVYYRDFVTGLAEESIASLGSAIDNRDSIGEDRYRLILFEDLVAEPDSVMRAACAWLEVPFHDNLTSPSKLGSRMESGSSFAPVSGVDSEASSRWIRHFESMTSSSERDAYNRYMAASDFAELYQLIPPESSEQSVLKWLIPYRNERVRDYLWRVMTRQARISESAGPAVIESMKRRLPKLITGN